MNDKGKKYHVSVFTDQLIPVVLSLVLILFGSAVRAKTLAVITWRGDTLAEQGLEKGLAAYPGGVTIKKYRADRNLARLAGIIQILKQDEPDVIYTYGTTVTQQVLEQFKDLPVVFNIVNRPVRSSIIKSWENSGNNATGASNQISVRNQLSTLKTVVDYKRLGVIYNPLEQNSRIQRDIAKGLEAEFNFTLIDFKVVESRNALKVIRHLKNRVDAVFIPADTMMVVHGTDLGKRLIQYKLPAMGSLSSMVTEHCILLGLVPDYYQLGILASSKVKQILDGKRPDQIPSSRLRFFDLYVNIKTASAMEVQLPMSLLIMSNTIVR